MEYWNIGILETPIIPLFHLSIIPYIYRDFYTVLKYNTNKH